MMHKRVPTANILTLRANLALKKQLFAKDKIAIFDEACVSKLVEYWHCLVWLPKGNKYARKRPRIHCKSLAIDRGKAISLGLYGNLQQDKSYFSIIYKKGIEKYLSFRKRSVEFGHIVNGCLAKIATHLQHFLSLIGNYIKVKEVKRLCKKINFTFGILKVYLAKGRIET